MEKGAPLESPVGTEAFPTSSTVWLNVCGGFHGESRSSIWESGPLLQELCCEPPGYPGCRSPQDALSVPSRDRLDLKSEHHSKSPRAHMYTLRVFVSASCATCAVLHTTLLPRQRLRPYHLPVAKSNVFASMPRPQALATFQPQPVSSCGCGCVVPCCA